MCDCLVAAGSETADGTPLFAKNSDRHENECQPFLQFPAASHPPGASVRCTHVAIPQVSETYRVMGHSPWWVWGFEHGVNEHRMAVGNLTVFSREEVEEEPGLIGMDLVRLGLERGRTAREALEVMAGLIEQYGQGGAAFGPGEAGYHNAFVLADPAEAWMFETSGRRWAARRATLDAHSNHMSLGSDWEIASRDLSALARTAGWWTNETRIDVAASYRNPNVPERISAGRLRRSRELLAQERGQLDPMRMQRILRDHLDGGEVRRSESTPEDEEYYTLCMHSEPVGTTTASLVAPLPPEPVSPWCVWVSFGTPCTGIFLPVYVDGVIPDALARGGEKPEDDSAWWAFKRLQDAAAADFERHTPVLREAWRDLERQIETERADVERRAAVAAQPDAAADLLSAFMAWCVEAALGHCEDLRGRLSA